MENAIKIIMKEYSFTEVQAQQVYDLGYIKHQEANIGGLEFITRVDPNNYQPNEYYIDVVGPRGVACSHYCSSDYDG